MIRDPDGVGRSIAQLLRVPQGLAENIAAKLRESRPQETDAGGASLITSLDEVDWSAQQKTTFLDRCATEMAAYNYTMDVTYRT